MATLSSTHGVGSGLGGTASAEYSHNSQGCCNGEQDPCITLLSTRHVLNFLNRGRLTLECSKDSCGPSSAASVSSAGNEVAEEDCGGDETSKPEEHCQALNTTDDPWVGEALELPRCEAEVDQGEKRPN